MGIPKFLLRRFGKPSGFFARLWAWLFNRGNRPENEAAVRMLGLAGCERVLDLGFGGGASFSALLAALPEGTVVGIDPVEEMVERARQIWDQEIAEGRLVVRQGTAGEIDLPENAVDAVLTVHTVYFWTDLDRGLDQVYRVLMPDGLFAMVVAHPSQLEMLGFEKVGYRVETPNVYADALSAAGFEDVHIRALDIRKPCSLIMARK